MTGWLVLNLVSRVLIFKLLHIHRHTHIRAHTHREYIHEHTDPSTQTRTLGHWIPTIRTYPETLKYRHILTRLFKSIYIENEQTTIYPPSLIDS